MNFIDEENNFAIGNEFILETDQLEANKTFAISIFVKDKSYTDAEGKSISMESHTLNIEMISLRIPTVNLYIFLFSACLHFNQKIKLDGLILEKEQFWKILNTKN